MDQLETIQKEQKVPNFLQLTKKGTSEPSDFITIDEEICNLMGVKPDPIHYAWLWYDYIGGRIAMGAELGSDKLRQQIKETGIEELCKILVYLEENYTSTSWARIGNPR